MSASANRSPRSRRGRVLVVGERIAATHMNTLLAQPAKRAANMFEAIGEIASSGANDPIAAIFIDDLFTRSPHESAIEAIRRLDPAVRIIAVANAPSASSAIGGSRAPDAWLDAALSAEDVRKAIDDDGLLAAAGQPVTAVAVDVGEAAAPARTIIDLDASKHDVEASVPPPNARSAAMNAETATAASKPATFQHSQECESVSAVAPSMTPSAAARTASDSADAAASARSALLDSPDPFRAAPVASAAQVAAPLPTPAGAIGDTDLIHALLHAPEGLTPLALKLIAHHGNWKNVSITPDSQITSDAPSIGVDVICEGHRIGRLNADGAEPGRLRPWADWLGHWLHIEREHHRFRHLANCDDLTGAWNRRFFDSFLTDAIAKARTERRSVTVMVFDIDNFKTYNDAFGHEAGDDILKEMVRLLRAVVRQGDIVCRIGGDEFVVVFADPEAPRTPGSKHPESVETIARRFQQAVCSMRFPKLGSEALGTLSVSGGLASYPWDGQEPSSLLRQADERALESKRKGKNALTFGPDNSD